MANAATKTGAGPALRLDPYRGSQTLEIGRKSFKLDTNGAVVRTTLNCGLKMNLAVPTKAFKGVAARAIENEDGSMNVSLELMHHDPELCVPLLYADDMTDIAADWHSWSRLMGLPMLIVGVDGEPTAVQKTLGTLMIEAPWERRKRITTVKRRPNFLRRRAAGAIGAVTKLTAEEIIARR